MGLHHSFVISVLFTGIVMAGQLMPESSTIEVEIVVWRWQGINHQAAREFQQN